MREMLIAVSAEGAFKRADACRKRRWRQIDVAVFTIRAQFEHGLTPEEAGYRASPLLARMSSQRPDRSEPDPDIMHLTLQIDANNVMRCRGYL